MRITNSIRRNTTNYQTLAMKKVVILMRVQVFVLPVQYANLFKASHHVLDLVHSFIASSGSRLQPLLLEAHVHSLSD